MFMCYRGGAVGHQHGKAGQPQHLPIFVEPIPTPEADDDDDDEVDDLLRTRGFASMAGGSGHENEDSESEDHESQNGWSGDTEDLEGELQSSSDEDQDDGALGPEDGEVPMGEDEAELAQLGFAPM